MTYTKEQRSEYNKKHYADNKIKYAESSRKARKNRLEKLNKLKESPCVDCGNTFHPCAMDFDHINEDKINDVSNMIRLSSWAKILEEIAKCELVCANCHRVRTWNRSNAMVLGMQIL